MTITEQTRCVRYDQLLDGRGVGRCATHDAWWTTDFGHCDGDRRPAWIKRMERDGLPPKDMTGAVSA